MKPNKCRLRIATSNATKQKVSADMLFSVAHSMHPPFVLLLYNFALRASCRTLVAAASGTAIRRLLAAAPQTSI
jgi:hypothetical protein